MIHYHGTPVGGSSVDVARFLKGRHAIVSFAYPDDIEAVATYCQSFVVDNGAFSVWTKGKQFDYDGYLEFALHWGRHPACDWVIIPDVIDGSIEDNESMLMRFVANCQAKIKLAPVWHLHEPVERLHSLCCAYRAGTYATVCLGSSGEWSTPGTDRWWERISEAMNAVCIDNVPMAKLHGLRMLSTRITTKLPLSSADSTNAARNSGNTQRRYVSPNRWGRTAVIADNIEAAIAATEWHGASQLSFDFGELQNE